MRGVYQNPPEEDRTPALLRQRSDEAGTLSVSNVSLIKFVAMAVIVAAVAIALLAFREYRKQQKEADRAYTQMIRLEDRAVAARKAIAALEDAEVREQNYVLTGETAYLETYKRSIGEWQDEIGVLEVQTGKGPLLPLVQDISKAGDRVVSELALIVSLYDAGSRDKALDRIRKSAGIAYLDQARETTRKIEEMNDEDASKAYAQFRPRQPLRRLGISVAGLLCLTLVSAGLLFLKSR